MEDEIAKEITNALLSNKAFTDIVSKRLTPLYADEGTVLPFVIYGIGEQSGITKDGGETCPVTISIYFDKKKYLECVKFKKIVKECFSKTNYEYQSSDTSFDSDTQTVVSNINFLTTK